MFLLIVTLMIHGEIQYSEQFVDGHDWCLEKAAYYEKKYPVVVVKTQCVPQ